MQPYKVEIASLAAIGGLQLLRWFCRYVLLPPAERLVGGWLWKLLARTPIERILWHHHKQKVQGLGHVHKTIQACPDNSCAKVN